jgi:hypothetical protein
LAYSQCMGKNYTQSQIQSHIPFPLPQDAFGRDDLRTKTRGVLTVEHCGRPVHRNDGICVTSLVTLDETSDPTSSVTDSYEWYDVEDEELRQRLREKSVDGATVALLDLY